MRTRKVPRGARLLRSYAEFDSYLGDFVSGLYPFIWAVGRPGVCKTESIRAAVGGRATYYRKGGQLTPLQFYIDCYRHRGEPVILDDAEHLLDDRVGAKLVSALADTAPAKFMSYSTTSRALGDVPPAYTTTSPLCVISNQGVADEAVLSRALVLHFDPTNREVHRAVAGWYWDQEIHDWFGRHLSRLPPLDVRWYLTAERDKRAGRDWRQLVLKSHAPDRASCVVQDLEGDPAYPTREDKGRRFLELLGTAKGASRATYFRLRRRLEGEGRLAPEAVPPVPLRRRSPPGVPSLVELESLDAPPGPGAGEEGSPPDLSAREQFARPIRGQPGPPTPPAPMVLDDLLPWERPRGRDDDEA